MQALDKIKVLNELPKIRSMIMRSARENVATATRKNGEWEVLIFETANNPFDSHNASSCATSVLIQTIIDPDYEVIGVNYY